MRVPTFYSKLVCRVSWRRRLSPYLDQELSETERAAMRAHLDSCDACRGIHDQLLFAHRALAHINVPDSQPASLPDWMSETKVRERRVRFPRAWIPVSVAGVLLLALIFGLWLKFRSRTTAPTFAVEVVRLSGVPEINAIPFQRPVALRKGERLVTDAWSTALIKFGRLGQIEAEFNTELELIESTASEQRLALKKGKIYASISAPPRMFLVNTPAGTAVDMGCAYSLEVDSAGETLLEVVSGWVALKLGAREELVPAGAACRARPGKGPGTPFLTDSSKDLQEAVNNFDFADGGAAALDVIMKNARQKDAITLWYLLRKVQGEHRLAIFERLNTLVPVPERVSRAGILELNDKMMQAWREPIEFASLGIDPRTVQFDRGALRATGALNEVRLGHTATLLPNGKVLVAGGYANSVTKTAELYDPSTETFTYTGSMTSRRVAHTATLLKNGKVLIVGGDSEDPFDGEMSSAEIYDPATGLFTATGSMRYPRLGHTATMLDDGRVLIIGGNIVNDYSQTACEIYDPATGKFSDAGKLHIARFDHSATLLADGKVLIAGGGRAVGAGKPIEIISAGEIYDPTNQIFSLTGSMQVARHKHSGILLSDGRVLVMGGANGYLWGGTIASAEVYDPAKGIFTATGQMATARYKISSAVVTLANHKVLVAGGGERIEIYDPASGIFTPVPGTIGAPRYLATATLLANNSAIIIGGYTSAPDNTGIRLLADAGAWIYTPGK